MKHFIGFCVVVFSCLTVLYFYKDDGSLVKDYASLKVYGSPTFIGSWGPGPKLKELFEKQTGIKITYLEMTDPSVFFQKMNFDANQAVGDVVLSLDQYDIAMSADKIIWKPIAAKEQFKLPENLKSIDQLENFRAYDWAPLAVVARNDLKITVESLDDLLKPELKGRIALIDPRTSSLGLNFLTWIYRVKTTAEAELYLQQLLLQVQSFSSDWFTAYNLFKAKQVDLVLSYATSPIYHLVEEKSSQYTAIEFKEGHATQVEYAGVPSTCANCDAAIRFVQFLQTAEAQRIIMEKNYMFPVARNVQEGTPFDSVRVFKLLPYEVEQKDYLQKLIGTWTDLRKSFD